MSNKREPQEMKNRGANFVSRVNSDEPQSIIVHSQKDDLSDINANQIVSGDDQ
jgi:Cu/Zn superoxide dismutase